VLPLEGIVPALTKLVGSDVADRGGNSEDDDGA
jgi:hypothetical protein